MRIMQAARDCFSKHSQLAEKDRGRCSATSLYEQSVKSPQRNAARIAVAKPIEMAS